MTSRLSVSESDISIDMTRRTVCPFGARPTDEEIIWFDITVDEVLLVDCLNSRKLRATVRGKTPPSDAAH